MVSSGSDGPRDSVVCVRDGDCGAGRGCAGWVLGVAGREVSRGQRYTQDESAWLVVVAVDVAAGDSPRVHAISALVFLRRHPGSLFFQVLGGRLRGKDFSNFSLDRPPGTR